LATPKIFKKYFKSQKYANFKIPKIREFHNVETPQRCQNVGNTKKKVEMSKFHKKCQNAKKFKNELKTDVLSDCPHAIYRRFPQMILVGFAETVVDTPTLQHCLDNCLKSFFD